jgi:hypothetical protein
MFRHLGMEELGIILIVAGLLLLVPAILFLLSMKKALDRCSFESRTMSPNSVWLMLIPLFNIVFQFIMVSRVASSLDNEFRLRGISAEPNPGKSVGITYCILGLLGFIPIIGIFASLVGLVCFLVYWAKIAGFSSKLTISPVVNKGTKKCPRCAEEIKVEALMCRFCNYEFPKEQIDYAKQNASKESEVKRLQDNFDKRWT